MMFDIHLTFCAEWRRPDVSAHFSILQNVQIGTVKGVNSHSAKKQIPFALC